MKINTCGASITWLWIASMLPQATADGGPSEGYVYAIYYGTDDCSDEPASMRGYASDQTFVIQGYSAAIRANETEGMDLCTLESLCVFHPTAEVCTVNDHIITDHNGMLSVSEEGLIFECDSTNPDAECSFLDPECYGSSIYPHCHFHIVTTSTLVEDPSVIQHSNPQNERALDLTSYMIFYSDEQCNNVEGLEAVVNNETNIMGMTTEDISCRDAILCALHPEGDELGSNCQELLGVDTPPTFNLQMMPISEDGHAVPCDANMNCEPMSPDTCEKSTLHPNCYYRLATAATFFGTPEEFLTNYVADDAAPGDEGEASGIPAETGDGVPTGEEDLEEDSSATMSLQFSATVAFFWALVTVLV